MPVSFHGHISSSHTTSAVPYLYAYDGIGNRASSSTNGVSTAYAANELNQYTAVGNAEPTYDISSNWGPDLSGTLQGAGGVGGLVAVSIGGQYYLPCLDAMGNVAAYLDETGAEVASFTYSAFGETRTQSGSMRGAFPQQIRR